jgi:hypothetical protein
MVVFPHFPQYKCTITQPGTRWHTHAASHLLLANCDQGQHVGGKSTIRTLRGGIDCAISEFVSLATTL